ncbi:winged helix-turn-helix transcriptional regulator [Candidatus Woesearchaeota archaeon]|nr:winged helix-turn-helix transcriptional regulator [Candidatus Woesearchaeota archaeon]
MYELDTKDHKIINILKENSRLSIRDIAKKTRIRPSTVHLRIKKLKKNNVIEKFTLKLNNKAVKEGFIVFMYLITDKNLPDSFFKNTHIKEAFGVTGEYDILLKLKFKDISEFNDYIINLRKNEAVKKTITNVVTANIKEELN